MDGRIAPIPEGTKDFGNRRKWHLELLGEDKHTAKRYAAIALCPCENFLLPYSGTLYLVSLLSCPDFSIPQ